jgi:hypothetical protein
MVKCLDIQDPKQQEQQTVQQNGFGHSTDAENNQQALNNDAVEDGGDEEWQEVGRKNRAFVTRRVCPVKSTCNEQQQAQDIIDFLIFRPNSSNRHYLIYSVANSARHSHNPV